MQYIQKSEEKKREHVGRREIVTVCIFVFYYVKDVMFVICMSYCYSLCPIDDQSTSTRLIKLTETDKISVYRKPG